MKEEYTKQQMMLWAQTNVAAGCAIVTGVFMIMGLLGLPPINWIGQGFLFIMLSVVGYLYYRLYKQTKETEE